MADRKGRLRHKGSCVPEYRFCSSNKESREVSKQGSNMITLAFIIRGSVKDGLES